MRGQAIEKIKVQDTINRYIRILKLTRRPSREEFLRISTIAIIVMSLIGTVGFLIYVLMNLLPRSL